jgi:hypothetical protein
MLSETEDAATSPAPPATPTASVVDPVARQLVGALLVGLVLLLPLRAALSTRTYGALNLWILIGLLAVVGCGLLLRVARVPRALATVAAAGGLYIGLVLVGLALVSGLDDPPADDTTVALIVGLPAAALACAGATAAVQWAEDIANAVGLGLCLLGAFLAAALGPSAYDSIDDARADAATIADLEAAGATAYLPEIDGWEPEFSSTGSLDGRTVSYSLRYQESGGTWEDPVVYVEVTTQPPPLECSELSGCTEAGGYQIFESDGEAHRIIAAQGSTYLVATFGAGDGAGELPDADEIGAALAGAEEVEWDEVLGLD